jgi:hypothetical protein
MIYSNSPWTIYRDIKGLYFFFFFVLTANCIKVLNVGEKNNNNGHENHTINHL